MKLQIKRKLKIFLFWIRGFAGLLLLAFALTARELLRTKDLPLAPAGSLPSDTCLKAGVSQAPRSHDPCPDPHPCPGPRCGAAHLPCCVPVTCPQSHTSPNEKQKSAGRRNRVGKNMSGRDKGLHRTRAAGNLGSAALLLRLLPADAAKTIFLGLILHTLPFPPPGYRWLMVS